LSIDYECGDEIDNSVSDDDRRGRDGPEDLFAGMDMEEGDRIVMSVSDGSMMIMISGAIKLAAASAAIMATMTLW